jgi:quinolinate synthase
MIRLQTALPETYTSASPEGLAQRIAAAKGALGNRLLILGHHYQRDEVMRWADARGDSFGLSRIAADRHDAEFVVFCGVHFMAESADILTGDHQRVLLPDLNAGCSMADMADLDAVEDAWDDLGAVTDVDRIVPVTYMNSSAALKAFVGRHGGAVCTSSNARAVLEWALGAGPGRQGSGTRSSGTATGGTGDTGARGDKVLFFPDQHLGRNTGYQLGYRPEEMVLWNPREDRGGLSDVEVKTARLLLWKGHCSVHQRFRPEHIAEFRGRQPDGIVLVHPECAHDVVELADEVGSTDAIIKAVERAEPGTSIGIATEIHLVNRLAEEHPDKHIECLDPLVCPCSTMFRIDAAHLAWILDGLVDGQVRNQIVVDPETARWADVALQRMLQIT